MSARVRTPLRGVTGAVTAVGASVLLLAGCGADGSSDAAPGGAAPAAPSSVAPTPSAPATTPPPSPSASWPAPPIPSVSVSLPVRSSAPGLPKAADGTDLAACADGSCEVQVRPGDEVRFAGGMGLDTYTVVDVGHDAVRHRATDGGNRLAGSLTAPGTAHLNELTVEIVDVEGDRAVIRLSTRSA